jgi:hypothetical protein
VGASALGELIDNLTHKDLNHRVKSVHLYAPACTMAFANRHCASQTEIMKVLHLDMLADVREREDSGAYIYPKSSLYFVSNALEADPRMPILGLANIFKPDFTGWDGSPLSAETLTNWRAAVKECDLQSCITEYSEKRITKRRGKSGNMKDKTKNASDGGFNNNTELAGQRLLRITSEEKLALPADDLVGFQERTASKKCHFFLGFAPQARQPRRFMDCRGLWPRRDAVLLEFPAL